MFITLGLVRLYLVSGSPIGLDSAGIGPAGLSNPAEDKPIKKIIPPFYQLFERWEGEGFTAQNALCWKAAIYCIYNTSFVNSLENNLSTLIS